MHKQREGGPSLGGGMEEVANRRGMSVKQNSMGGGQGLGGGLLGNENRIVGRAELR